MSSRTALLVLGQHPSRSTACVNLLHLLSAAGTHLLQHFGALFFKHSLPKADESDGRPIRHRVVPLGLGCRRQ